MKLTVIIEMDNAAFGDDDSTARGFEAGRILGELRASVQDGIDAGSSGKLRDINGNTVGSWKVEE